ncbi:MAG: hypothetical protein K5868_10370 [Lachnospiraceae bacterium]|nr:hypothetical protein [Lachnospiraceae bacterium]
MFDLNTDSYTGNYDEAVSYLETIPRFNASAGFAGASAFYAYLTKKELLSDCGCKVFHIAGTNGKGSVCAFLKSIHMQMGRSVGVFTSPHLIDIRERIALNDEVISKEDFLDCFMTVMSCLGEFRKQESFKDYMPVYFDYLFFIAALYYAKQCPDAIIWETGLGGRLDATNVIGDKSVTVITEIGLDHMAILGNTKEAIAAEKAGIIRKGVPVITVNRDREVYDVISSEAKSKGCPLTVVPSVYEIRKKMNDKGIDFSYKSHYYNNATLEVVGHALYQTENASLAVAAMEAVYSMEELPFEYIYEGVRNMYHPGRMEELVPGVIFDGAHNEDGIEAFIDSVKSDNCKGQRFMIFSSASDKQAEKELRVIVGSGLFAGVYIVSMDTDRSRTVKQLKALTNIVTAGGITSEYKQDIKQAYDCCKALIKQTDRLYVCGSLYLYEELKAYINSVE